MHMHPPTHPSTHTHTIFPHVDVTILPVIVPCGNTPHGGVKVQQWPQGIEIGEEIRRY